MGLDMYLNAKRGLYPTLDKEEKRIIGEIKQILPEIKAASDGQEQVDIAFRIGYWRKANHIHGWFVQTVQEGEDDCGEYHVSRERLQELLTLCKTAIEKKDQAGNILPTQEGFFFGSTDYDEGYFSDIEATIKIIKDCLKLSEDWEFYYHSSW
jgi:hypothetical protein